MLTGACPQYDALIFDEGQDLRTEWVQTLEETLLRAEGSLLVLYDPLQDVYRVGEELSARYGAPYPLTTNCRNTRSICTFLRETLPRGLAHLRPGDHATEGLPPKVQTYRTPEDQRAAITRLVHFLVNEHGLRPRQIQLLSPYRRERVLPVSLRELI